MTKTLVLVRHGHRDIDADERDNGLTARGRLQALAVADFFAHRFPDVTPILMTSPKRRCRETLAPLAERLGLPLAVSEAVDEARPGDTSVRFEERVGNFLQNWRSSRDRLTLVCSHNDWIPRATRLLIGRALDVPNGSWFEVEERGGVVELAWYAPEPAPLLTRS